MHTLNSLSADALASISGGGTSEGGQRDTLATDLGQFVGGYFGTMISHPFLSAIPVFGNFLGVVGGFQAATH